MRKPHWFQLAAYSILFIFMGLMTYVTSIAYMRRSGYTGMDVAKIQQIRYEEVVRKTDAKNTSKETAAN